MKASFKSRAIALVASIVVTFTTVQLIATNALPEQPVLQMAQATPRG